MEKNIEKRRSPLRRSLIVLGLGTGILSLASCSLFSPQDMSEKNTTQETVQNNGDIRVKHEFTPTGKRITSFDTPERYAFNAILAYCDGSDLVELANSTGTGVGSVERQPNHEACDDGKLDPSDFLISGNR